MPDYDDLADDLASALASLEAELEDDDLDRDMAALSDLLGEDQADQTDQEDLRAELVATLEQAVNLVWRLRRAPDTDTIQARFVALEKRATQLLARIRAHLKEM